MRAEFESVPKGETTTGTATPLGPMCKPTANWNAIRPRTIFAVGAW